MFIDEIANMARVQIIFLISLYLFTLQNYSHFLKVYVYELWIELHKLRNVLSL